MDKLKYSLFDFFSYFLPTFALIFGIYLLQEKIEITSINLIAIKFSTLSFENYLLLIPIIYLMGFIMNIPSNYFYKFIEFLLSFFNKTKKVNIKTNIRNSEMYILVREFSPNNFIYIEQWNVYKKLSINLLFSAFSYFTIRIFIFDFLDWQSFLTFFVISFFLVKITRQFDRWRIIECINTIELFKLNENPEKKFDLKWQK